MAESKAETVHIADWVLREGAERIIEQGIGLMPMYGANTVLRLLDKIDACAQALWDIYLDSCSCHMDYGSRCSCKANGLAEARLRDLLGDDWHETCRLRFSPGPTGGG